MSDTDPWAHVGEPPQPLAGFGWDDLQLPPDQAAMLRSLELAERAEQREREERLAERQERAYNMAVAESIGRAHAHGEAWDPANPLKHYPTAAERTDMVFAAMDAHIHAELAQAKREAAAVLKAHGVHGQVVVDANAPSPHPGVSTVSSGSPNPPAGVSNGMGPAPEGAAQRAGLNPMGTRIRAAFTRWATPTRTATRSACRCAACDPGSVHRADADAGLPPREITRTFYAGARIR